ncbi:aminomethyltransferas-like protein [Patellaria atrata CBS 101060]|uniref:Aminomethyltransferase n=1 Tax=Patellaria atrata CBS 101060 TaxID=1346257 RepID=A0A9P4SGU4_9PEZI|nr:aminomethyltransferas-like protein [Patellaria atrata CBS 101060]
MMERVRNIVPFASRPSQSSTQHSNTRWNAGQIRRSYASTPTSGEVQAKTPLYDLHAKYGAKFVPFGGYQMPVQYKDLSISDSHNWTREKASLFDVSHMVQHIFSGPGATGFLERITPSSISSLGNFKSTLSTFLHPYTGGIVDDTVITRIDHGRFHVVTNAGCRSKDTRYFADELRVFQDKGGEKVNWEVKHNEGLIALQGPLAAEILQGVIADRSLGLRNLLFGQCTGIDLRLKDGTHINVLVSRGGYTGEDGFEISVAGSAATALVETLLASAGEDKLRLAGLGARDSLRLEAGLCLYGHDLDDTTTPVEAGLSWIIGKDRRTGAGFHGAEVILAQLKPKKDGGRGVDRRRVGLIVEGAPAREGAQIVDEAGNEVGKVTSGCPSPTLKKFIAMGYVKSGMNKAGTKLEVVVRGKKRPATVTKMPFVPTKYWRGEESATT